MIVTRNEKRKEEKARDIMLGERCDRAGRSENVERFEKVDEKGTDSSDVENHSPISSHSWADSSEDGCRAAS